MDKLVYDSIIRIFHPGYEVASVQHPVLDNLANPFFKKILTYTNQATFILNHTTFKYSFVSENAGQILGFSSEELMSRGSRIVFEQMHPDDMSLLSEVVYPEYYRCMDRLPDDMKVRLKSTIVLRIRKPDGRYIKIFQQNIPLTIENGKVILGLIVATDVSDYKLDDKVIYKNVLIEGPHSIRVLSQGLGEAERLLTDREITVLRMMGNGFSEKQIASNLGLSIYTIKAHKKNMMRKAKSKNATELVRYGMANLLI